LDIKKPLKDRIIDFLVRKKGVAGKNEISNATPYVNNAERQHILDELESRGMLSKIRDIRTRKDGMEYLKVQYKLIKIPGEYKSSEN
jgi:hypothetical protein